MIPETPAPPAETTPHIESAAFYEALFQRPLDEVLTLFDETERSAAQQEVERCYQVVILEQIARLPEPVQAEFLTRSTSEHPAADGQPPVSWLLAAGEAHQPGFTDILKQAIQDMTQRMTATLEPVTGGDTSTGATS